MASTTSAPPPGTESDWGATGGGGGGLQHGRPAPVSTFPAAVRPSQTGIGVALAAISMMFAALTSAMVVRQGAARDWGHFELPDRKSTRLNSSHLVSSYAVFCLKEKSRLHDLHLHLVGLHLDAVQHFLAEVGVLVHDTERLLALLAHEIVDARFFFNDTATTDIYTLSLHDALPI